jgi:hypothetical protein
MGGSTMADISEEFKVIATRLAEGPPWPPRQPEFLGASMTALSRSRLAAEEALLDRFTKTAEAGEMLNINDLKKAYEEESAIRPARTISNLLRAEVGYYRICCCENTTHTTY